MKTDIVNYIKILFLTVILVTGASYLKAWSGATQTAPNGNVAAPLNIGTTVQTKLGSLVLNAATPIQNAIGLTVFGTSTFNGHIIIADGTQGADKVLISDANGVAKWVPISSLSLGGSGVTKIVAGTHITISPTSGTGVVTISSTAASTGGGSTGGGSTGGGSSGGGTASGTVGGGCTTISLSATYTAVYSVWGNATNPYGGCFCPSGYSRVQSGTQTIYGHTGQPVAASIYQCIAN